MKLMEEERMASMSKKAEKGTVGSKWAKFKRYLPLYLMFLPGAIYLFINNYLHIGEFRQP